MNQTKFFEHLATMPTLRHSLPDQEFEIIDSEVVQWLVADRGVLQWLFNKARETKRIKFNKDTGAWSGVGLEVAATMGKPRRGRPRRAVPAPEEIA